MATAKQLAALAKARAARAKKAGAKPATKKPRKKVAVKAPSRATGKTPTKRLQTRRKKNTAAGYYPNPATVKKCLVFLQKKGGKKYYLHLTGGKASWDTRKNAGFDSDLVDELAKKYGRLALKQLPSGWAVYKDEVYALKKK
jgi:hypothetical protein